MMTTSRFMLILFLSTLIVSSCREDEKINPSTGTEVESGSKINEVKGFYLLNQGNMGSNKCTLDYLDYESGKYTKNIYAERNPNVVKELGDVGNDLKIYGSKLYAVINCSNLVEVMDVSTAKHIGQISIPNCRYITFHKGYAYVTSYAGPVAMDPKARLGYVAKIDTLTMSIVGSCTVGYQPEEMAVCSDKLYVANSGGYRAPNYDNTVSVIDLNTFKVINTIEVGINLHHVKKDKYNNLWISSIGNYNNIPSKTYVLDTKTDKVTHELNIPNSNMTIFGDSLYLYSSAWSNAAGSFTTSYAIININTKKLVSDSIIKDGTDKNIVTPYGIAINPKTREIYVTDAKDYVTPGTLYCFTPDGKKKWSTTTGDIPAVIEFTNKKLK